MHYRNKFLISSLSLPSLLLEDKPLTLVVNFHGLYKTQHGKQQYLSDEVVSAAHIMKVGQKVLLVHFSSVFDFRSHDARVVHLLQVCRTIPSIIFGFFPKLRWPSSSCQHKEKEPGKYQIGCGFGHLVLFMYFKLVGNSPNRGYVKL